MNFVFALLAGFLTFFTPCVFPLIPSYISYITGFSVDELCRGDTKGAFEKALYGSLCFVAGFTVVFISLGFTASYLGSFVQAFQVYIRVIGGVFIIFFGLLVTGLVNIQALDIEHRLHLRGRPGGYAGSFLFGMTFGAGWLPCSGPVLSSILILAAEQGTQLVGGLLLMVYSIGLAVPIVLSAVGLTYFLAFYKRAAKYIRYIQLASGLFLIFIGAALVLGSVTHITAFFSRFIHFEGI